MATRRDLFCILSIAGRFLQGYLDALVGRPVCLNFQSGPQQTTSTLIYQPDYGAVQEST